MIEYTKGNILESDADFVVCPVNCVGTMGAGLAKQMKLAWPSLDLAYQRALRSGDLTVIKPHTVTGLRERKGGVVLFPTKFHYNDTSDISSIRLNLDNIKIHKPFMRQGLVTIAFPKLGCGLGGLHWAQVAPLIESFARFNEDTTHTIVYE